MSNTIAERLNTINTELNTVLSNTNTQLTQKGQETISDIKSIPNAISNLKNPTGTIDITENGTIDVSNYASANVDVSGGASEIITHEEYLEDVELARSILQDFVPYTEVEYIKSDGNQYVDTGYYPNQNTKIDMVMESINWGDYKNPFGVRTSNYVSGSWVYTNRFALWLYANKSVYFQINSDREVFELTKAYTATKFHLIAKNGYVYIKDLTNNYEAEEHTFSEISDDFVTDFSMPLGALRQSTETTSLCKFKLYSCKIYENDTLVKDLIPVINRLNDEACLYDKVNKTFLYGSGTGKLTAGGVVNV